jgi:nucleoside-diphosphate-sugar epimerase
MRVFVTGASGWVGSALVPELVRSGHEVVGLARSEASMTALALSGAQARRGSLEDLDSLREGAAESDGVVHLAFIHDFSQYDAANEVDRQAITAMGAALEGSGRPLVVASGVPTTAERRPATEADPPSPGFPRSEASALTVDLASSGVRSSVVRLPPTVHGRGDHGFISMIVGVARQRGVSGYTGDGSNVWPAVHCSDAAGLFRLALEGAAAGSTWHAVADEGVPTRAIAEVIARHLDVPVVSIAPDDAGEHFGWIGMVWGADIPATSAFTRERLGWQPTGPSLVQDLEAGHYFEPGAGEA